MNKPIVLRTEGLGKYFYDPIPFKVLDNVNLEVHRGEFLTIVGKSGCGKSTLLYCLSTMDSDYEGKIYCNNELVTGMNTDKLATLRNRSIGFVFQFHYLLPEFSCLKNVMIPALRLGAYSRAETEARAYEKLSLLGLADQALKPASKLSGGQQQRVAIARAMINNPDIIMGDEPTGNLDSRNTALVFESFQRIAQELGQTVIAVTHDNDFAKASHRIVEMADGRIVRHG